MRKIMRSNLIKIGNSKGIRITSSIIKECELGNEVEIKVVDKKLIIEAGSRTGAPLTTYLPNLDTQNGSKFHYLRQPPYQIQKYY